MTDDIQKVKSKSFVSAVSLVGSSSYSALLGFAAFFILTLKSGACLLGIYNTVIATLSIFAYFTNLGLAAAIMQKPKVRQIDLNSAFYIQLFLTLFGVLLGFVVTPHVMKFYGDLPKNAVYLYWAILASFVLLTLKTVPSVLMEKKIEIYKVVLAQALENTAFYVTVIAMVLLDFTIEAFVVAVLVRAVIGLVVIYALNPWIPTLSFSWDSAKRLLSYGIPFQGNSLLALVKDDLLVLYLGGAIGLTNLGYVMFAKKYAEFSIRVIMDNVNRVGFPLFAMYQNTKDMLKKSLHKVFFYESFFIFPIVIGAMFIFDSLLRVIPGYFDKWSVALFSFYFFSLYAIMVSLYSPLINFFNAIGRVRTSLYFMVIFTVLTWGLVPLFIKISGVHYISVAFLVMSLFGILVVFKAKEYLQFSLTSFIRDSTLATLVMLLVLVVTRAIFVSYLSNHLMYLIIAIPLSALVYFAMIYRLKGKRFYQEIIELFDIRGRWQRLGKS